MICSYLQLSQCSVTFMIAASCLAQRAVFLLVDRTHRSFASPTWCSADLLLSLQTLKWGQTTPLVHVSATDPEGHLTGWCSVHFVVFPSKPPSGDLFSPARLLWARLIQCQSVKPDSHWDSWLLSPGYVAVVVVTVWAQTPTAPVNNGFNSVKSFSRVWKRI